MQQLHFHLLDDEIGYSIIYMYFRIFTNYYDRYLNTFNKSSISLKFKGKTNNKIYISKSFNGIQWDSNPNNLISLINVALRLIFLWNHSRPYAVIKDPTFIYFWKKSLNKTLKALSLTSWRSLWKYTDKKQNKRSNIHTDSYIYIIPRDQGVNQSRIIDA